MNVAVSVIIPTYNPGDYILECLESLACQTLCKGLFELIVILNGCDEPYSSHLSKWGNNHPGIQITVIQTDTPGVSNARNLGINAATGEYIAFIDDDDYVSPTYLERLLNKAKDIENCVVLSNSISFIDGTHDFDESFSIYKIFNRLKSQKAIDIFHTRSFFNGPCMKLISKTIINNFSFDTKLRNGEDSLFMFEISKNIKQISLAENDAIYFRRFRQNSASTRHRTLKERTGVMIQLITKYTVAYIKSPFKYNFLFYVSRVLATVKGQLLAMK